MAIVLNSDGKVECLICRQWFGTVRALSTHVAKGHSMAMRAYYDTHAKGSDEGTCRICGKPTGFRSVSEGYAETCSPACRGKMFSQSPDRIERRKLKTEETNLVKYGVANVFQSEDIKARGRATNLARRGVEYPTQSREVIEKAKATYVERYGADTYLHSKVGSAAVRNTNTERFGTSEYFASEEGKAKCREGMLRNYGVETPMESPELRTKAYESNVANHGGVHSSSVPEVKEKIRNTQVARYGDWFSATEYGRSVIRAANREKFGVDEFFSSDQFATVSRETLITRYGVDNYAKTAEYRGKVAATNMIRYKADHYLHSDAYRQNIISRYNQLFPNSGCTVISMGSKNNVTYRCDTCGAVCVEQMQFIMHRSYQNQVACTACNPKNPESSFEEQTLREYVESLGFHTDHYARGFIGGYGADIVVEECKVIIEYDGIGWHNERFKSANYHLEKSIAARECGYRMVHVFSDEWAERRDIVKSRISAILGCNKDGRIYARKCAIVTVEPAAAKLFFDTNHIQGHCQANITYGLTDTSGKLVAAMSFGRSRFAKDDRVELLRFCSILGTHVVGGASRLFKYYLAAHPKVDTVVTYADARWSGDESMYTKIGFEFDGMSDPGYFYVVGNRRENRMKYQKHKLLAESVDTTEIGLTEHEIMTKRGFFRIYDCGNYRFVWTRN